MKNVIDFYYNCVACLSSINDSTNRIFIDITTGGNNNPRLTIGDIVVTLEKNTTRSIEILKSQYPEPGNNLIVKYEDDLGEYTITLSFKNIDESKNMTLKKIDDGTYLVQYASSAVDAMVNLVYPVGSIYETDNGTFDPNTTWEGTTWERIKGRVIVGVDENDPDFNAGGKTGGEKSHRLIDSEMPKHSHYADNNDGTNKLTGDSVNMGYGDGTDHGVGYCFESRWAFRSDRIDTGIRTAACGGDAPHNNLQPYYIAYIWRRTA